MFITASAFVMSVLMLRREEESRSVMELRLRVFLWPSEVAQMERQFAGGFFVWGRCAPAVELRSTHIHLAHPSRGGYVSGPSSHPVPGGTRSRSSPRLTSILCCQAQGAGTVHRAR